MLYALPEKIEQLTEGLRPMQDNTGMSGVNIYIFDNMVLKVERTSETSDNECNVMRWLDGKLPVPKVIHFERAGGFNYLLMSKLQGEMACSEANISNHAILYTDKVDLHNALSEIRDFYFGKKVTITRR